MEDAGVISLGASIGPDTGIGPAKYVLGLCAISDE